MTGLQGVPIRDLFSTRTGSYPSRTFTLGGDWQVLADNGIAALAISPTEAAVRGHHWSLQYHGWDSRSTFCWFKPCYRAASFGKIYPVETNFCPTH
jgi:hypothetical protein